MEVDMRLVLVGLCGCKPSSAGIFANSMFVPIEVLVLDVARDDLEPFNEGLLDTAELDMLDPREGGSA
jgi:hypothetical protein